jgi:hypothetical protein
MSENLYFMPIIAQGLQERDSKKALREGFCEIKRLGTKKRYAEGFSNFQLFMDSAYRHHKTTTMDCACELIAQLVTGTFDGNLKEAKTLLEFIKSHPDLKMRYESIRRMEEDEGSGWSFPLIGVSSDRGYDVTMEFKEVPGSESFEGVLPGNYKIGLVNTGWTIWLGELTARELIATDLRLAAGDDEGRPTSQKDLLDNGEVILRTYAGIESGSIEIELVR